MPEVTHSSCPVVKEEDVTLYERVEVGGKCRFFPFQQKIVWVREAETVMRLMHGDVEVKELGTLTDFYGFLSSLKTAVTVDAPRIAKAYLITAKTMLTIRVDVTISDIPLMHDESEEGRRWNADAKRKQYIVPRSRDGRSWYTSDKPVKDEAFASYPTLESVKMVEEKGIYLASRDGILMKLLPRMEKWVKAQQLTEPPVVK